MQNNNYDFFFWLSVIANFCQLESYRMNKEDLMNNDLMEHLLEQDKVLDNQNNIYFKKVIEQNEIIIKQNEELLNILKKGK